MGEVQPPIFVSKPGFFQKPGFFLRDFALLLFTLHCFAKRGIVCKLAGCFVSANSPNSVFGNRCLATGVCVAMLATPLFLFSHVNQH